MIESEAPANTNENIRYDFSEELESTVEQEDSFEVLEEVSTEAQTQQIPTNENVSSSKPELID